jgi:homoserine dehydrogenase
MMSEEPVGIGIIGLGTIGTGVAKVLRRNGSVISQKLGFPLRLLRVADIDTERARGVDLRGVRFDCDSEGLIADPEVSIVIELIGGYDAAKRLTLRAIEQGKHVVTANKALLALHGKEIFDAASSRGVDVAFEASVGGGIPILRSMREGLAANRIQSLHGIMNGTTNYVLTEMDRTGELFDVVVKRAQDLGYAEADPSIDVDGIDAAHKLTLLAAMAFGAELTYKDIPTEGIRGLAPLDFEAAEEFGYRIKLLGIAKLREGEDGEERVEVRVHPTMIPESSLLAKVDGAMNAIAASAVVADTMEVAREIRRGTAGRVAPLSYMPDALRVKPLVPIGELRARSYLVFTVLDRPGVLGHIASALGESGISIESVLQKGQSRSAGAVPIIVLTHPAREFAIQRAMAEIDRLPEVTAPTRLVRIEEDF